MALTRKIVIRYHSSPSRARLLTYFPEYGYMAYRSGDSGDRSCLATIHRFFTTGSGQVSVFPAPQLNNPSDDARFDQAMWDKKFDQAYRLVRPIESYRPMVRLLKKFLAGLVDCQQSPDTSVDTVMVPNSECPWYQPPVNQLIVAVDPSQGKEIVEGLAVASEGRLMPPADNLMEAIDRDPNSLEMVRIGRP